MNLQDIARALSGVRSGASYLCRCPVPSHGKGKGDRRPSLSIAAGDDGRLLVKCFSGCDPRDVLSELRRRGLLDDAPEAKRAPLVQKARPEAIEPCPDALALWRAREPIGEHTVARRYLRARGITADPPPSLGFLPAFEHIAGRIYLPAIVAALQAGDRRIIAAQATMLDPRGDRKAQVRFPRKTFGRMGDGAVRLGPAGEALGLAEGLETALAAQQLFGLPVWACLGAGRMHSVAVPDNVRELHLFADNDDAGRSAVAKTLEAHRRRRVVVHFPAPPVKDWNDALLALQTKESAA